MASSNNNRSNNNNSRGRTGKQQQRRRHHPQQRQRHRLWELPESSIADYAKWIQEKPEEDQTPAEQRFVWKYLVKQLQQHSHNQKDKPKLLVERLQAKGHRSAVEEDFLRLYSQRRQRQRKDRNHGKGTSTSDLGGGDDDDDAADILWQRVPNNPNNVTMMPSSSLPSSLANLRESMKRLGLDSDKLKQAVPTTQQQVQQQQTNKSTISFR
jgi:hypothetical protein